MKRAMHAVDPLQRLRLLQRRLPQLTSEIAFHHEMTEIFTSLRDLHTQYILPTHFAQMVAFLPFRVEACFENGEREYIVAQTVPSSTIHLRARRQAHLLEIAACHRSIARSRSPRPTTPAATRRRGTPRHGRPDQARHEHRAAAG